MAWVLTRLLPAPAWQGIHQYNLYSPSPKHKRSDQPYVSQRWRQDSLSQLPCAAQLMPVNNTNSKSRE